MKLVIDISKDRYDEIMSMDWNNCRRFFDEELRAIHDGKALEQEPSKWIPVSERLPESCGMYIVTRKIYDCPDTAPIIMSDESWFDGQNTWHNDNRINHERRYLSDVIAWCELPEPYQSEIPTGAEGSDKE